MEINTAKQRLLAGRPAVGPVLSLGSPLIAELMSVAGFDYVIVDNQHGAWDDAASLQAIQCIGLGTAVPMARALGNDFYRIGRLLDQGALGIIVPMVNSAEEARAAAFAVRYPPRGGRSLGPFGARHHGPDYGRWIDDQVFLAVQIETRQALDHAEEILAVEGVDGCWIGPFDLARSLGIDLALPGGWEALDPALERVLDACRRTNKIPGIYAADQGPLRLEQGFLFVTVCSDVQYVAAGARDTLRAVAPYRA